MNRLTKLKVAFGSLAATAAVAYADFLCEEWEHRLERKKIEERLQFGHCDKPYYQEERFLIDRKSERKPLAKCLSPDENSRFYYVISGPHGCGKSRLIKETACELIEETKEKKKDCGIIMADVRTSKHVAVDIARSMGIAVENEPQTLPGKLRSHFGYRYRPLYTIPNDAETAIDYIGNVLATQGRQFKEKNRRPLVIGLDDINVLADRNDQQLERLQHWAKKLADDGLVIFAFIDSGGIALQNMRKVPGRASRMKEFIVQDISEKDAKAFLSTALEDCNVDGNEVYDKLTNGRLQHLHWVREIVQNEKSYTYEALSKKLIGEVTFSSLQPCDLHTSLSGYKSVPERIRKRHELIKEMMKGKGKLSTEKATTTLGLNAADQYGSVSAWEADLKLLVKKDILLYCDGGKELTFHSRLVETALKEVFC
ncbi:uncharacterized protein [Oscarella lobularis]|uniref:uncharacterized protein n=1 Tax=Oscarella lobularis TaxID=121494 RepID=UPI0033133DC1